MSRGGKKGTTTVDYQRFLELAIGWYKRPKEVE